MKCKELADYIGLFTYVSVVYEKNYDFKDYRLTREEFKEEYGEKEILSINAEDDWAIYVRLKV